MLIYLIIAFAVAFAIYFYLKTKPKPQTKPPVVVEEPPQPIPDRSDFDKRELIRREKQRLERDALLSSLGYTEDSIKEELATLTSQYKGRRITKTVQRVGNGFEFLPVPDSENLELPGVYAIYCGATLLYVGKTDRPIKTRLKEHAKCAKYPEEGGAQQNFLYKAMREHSEMIEGRVLAYAFENSKDEIALLEMQFIRELQPICNIVGVTR